MRNINWKSGRLTLAIMGAAALAACSLSGSDREPTPFTVFRYQQLWLTPDQRDAAQCWNGAALICSKGLGRLSALLCECPLNAAY